jgi:hypothetical protein
MTQVGKLVGGQPESGAVAVIVNISLSVAIMWQVGAAIMTKTIDMVFIKLMRAGLGVKVGPAVSTGNGMDFLVGRLSYTFGLTGACSCKPSGLLLNRQHLTPENAQF